MGTRDIPRDQWREELDLFSREHEGTPARLRVSDRGQRRTEAHDLRFHGASVDSPHSSRIEISLGDTPSDHLTHEIANAVAVAIDDTQRPGGRLEVRAADGTTTTVEFQ